MKSIYDEPLMKLEEYFKTMGLKKYKARQVLIGFIASVSKILMIVLIFKNHRYRGNELFIIRLIASLGVLFFLFIQRLIFLKAFYKNVYKIN